MDGQFLLADHRPGSARLTRPTAPGGGFRVGRGPHPQDQPLRKDIKMTTATVPVNNGVNTEALIGARGAFEQAPQAARFTFRSTCDWIEGTFSANGINGYFGLGQDHERSKTFRIESDHPEVFAAADRGPTPPEIVLAALASCLTGGVASVAQHRGIQLKSVRATVEGDIDVDDLLAVLVANAATLKMVSIEGEVLRMTHACCRELVGAAKRGVKIDF